MLSYPLFCETQWRHRKPFWMAIRWKNAPILHCIRHLGENNAGQGYWVSRNYYYFTLVTDKWVAILGP